MVDAPGTVFAARICAAAGAVLLAFGWLFLVAGTGLALLVVGCLSFAAALALDHSRPGIDCVGVSILVGLTPFGLFLIWVVTPAI